MKIDWKTRESASRLYAARAVWRGAEDDPRRERLRPAMERLSAALRGVDSREFWRLAVPLAAAGDLRQEQSRRLADALAATTPGAVSLPPGELEAAIDRIEQAATAAVPELELPLSPRVRPLREQWEARGPGFLRALREAAGGTVVETATVCVVYPVNRGGGSAFPDPRIVAVEGVLYHTTAVPEMVRLGWLLARLGVGNRGGERAPGGRPGQPQQAAVELAAWAVLPAVLEAARHVQWLDDSHSLGDLLSAWRLCSAEEAEERLEVLRRWWAETAGRAWQQRLTTLADTLQR